MKRRITWKNVLEVVIVTAVLGGLCWWFLIRGGSIIKKYEPASSIRICEFLQGRTDIRNINLIERDGIQFIRVILDPMPLPALPSGPPMYVFDSNGLIADWTSGVDDGDAVASSWATARIIKPLEHDCEAIERTLHPPSRSEQDAGEK